ncbi:MAG: peptidase T, partial [Clostridia bacterium]|nr:peptidase T [Clostridia bacterium]
MRPYERMINYCKIHTTSDESSESTPSAAREFALADLLADELRAIGVSDVRRTDTCNVYGKIPATPGYESAPKIGWVAHLDTAPDFCGENVRPLIWENYDGKDIRLPECGRVIRVSDFPYLKDKKGKTLITASGDTLLGADDKAGIAEIVCMCERLLKGGIPHGPVRIAF